MSNPFSNSKKITAASVTSRVLGDFDDPLPGIIAGAAVSGLDIAEEIINYNSNGLFRKTEQFYKYGRDYFVRGLPEQIVYNATIDNEEIKRILSGLNSNADIRIQYALLDTDPDIYHHVYQYLQDTRLRNPTTNIIGNSVGLGVITGSPIKFVEYNNVSGTFGYQQIKYTYTELGVDHTIYETPPTMFTDRYVYQIAYNIRNGLFNQSIKYFTYYISDGTYPVLSRTAPTGNAIPTEHYPIIPFYEDKVQIGAESNKGTPLYDTSKKLLQKLGMDYKDVVNKLAEGTEESIGKDKGLYAYLLMSAEVTAGIPKFADAGKTSAQLLTILKEAQPTINYLIEYFQYLEKSQLYDISYWNTTEKWVYVTQLPSRNVFEIQDGTYKQRFEFNYIQSQVKSGSIGEIGWCTNTYDLRTKDYTTYIINDSSPSNRDTISINLSRMVYRKQLTIATYLEVVVDGLLQKTTIFGDTDAASSPAQAFKEDPLLCCIPLHRPSVLKVENKLRNRLMHASLIFTFNAYEIVEVKWYQSSFWSFAINIAAIAFALPTGGMSLNWSTAFTAAALNAAAKAFLYYAFKYILISEAVQFVSRKLGAEVALALSAIFVLYGKFGSKTGAMPGLPWASEILNIGTTMWKSSNDAMKDQLQDVQADAAKLKDESTKLNDELAKAQNLLTQRNELDPWLFVNAPPDLLMGQSANDFIQIRKEMNPGLVTIQSANNYVDLMLTLPTIDETLRM